MRSHAPRWLFRDPDVRLEAPEGPLDPGVLQPNGLEIDLPATADAHRALLAGWDEHVAREAHALQGASLVVADLPPLAFAAASRASVPAFGVANFGWDWILEPWAGADAIFARAAARYRECHQRAEALFRLPLHGAFPAFRHVRDVPLLVRRARGDRASLRSRLGLAPDAKRPLVLVSFGGLGHGALAGRPTDDLAGFHFVGFGPRPAALAAGWTALPTPSPIPHEVLVAACDAVIGKPGYGTVAECLAHRTPLLYVPRHGFRETRVLEAGLARWGHAAAIPPEDFLTGHWRRALEALLGAEARWAALATDGAETIADSLLERLEAL